MAVQATALVIALSTVAHWSADLAAAGVFREDVRGRVDVALHGERR